MSIFFFFFFFFFSSRRRHTRSLRDWSSDVCSSDLPWGEQVTEYILYMLWDLGQKVGHAVRSVDDCIRMRSEEHTSELQSRRDLVCRLLLEKKKKKKKTKQNT